VTEVVVSAFLMRVDWVVPSSWFSAPAVADSTVAVDPAYRVPRMVAPSLETTLMMICTQPLVLVVDSRPRMTAEKVPAVMVCAASCWVEMKMRSRQSSGAPADVECPRLCAVPSARAVLLLVTSVGRLVPPVATFHSASATPVTGAVPEAGK
jgi:hypothetical protein